MSETLDREKALFNEALALPSAEARLQYLENACGPDRQLRDRLEALLRAHDAAQGFIPDLEDPRKLSPTFPTGESGERVGRYKLLEKLGEGGCGVVYVAEQEEPVRRRVALKIIKLGLETRSVVARFEAERQALALMDHPNIAKFFDAGVVDGGSAESQSSTLKSESHGVGRPYFVMELVRGLRLTDYCQQNQLTTPQRLQLFVQVCHAVQHAHQKGIIHRDLKPSNVLVTEVDGKPVPKVIDFGIAKATE